MEKQCKKCKKNKPLTEFYTDKTTKNGYMNNCKTCQSEKRHSKKTGLHYVYTIGDYAGCTNAPHHRIACHKANGKDITQFRVIASLKSRKEALELEELLHDIGYQGKHAFNTYK